MTETFKIDKIFGCVEILPTYALKGNKLICGGIIIDYDRNDQIVSIKEVVNLSVKFNKELKAEILQWI